MDYLNYSTNKQVARNIITSLRCSSERCYYILPDYRETLSDVVPIDDTVTRFPDVVVAIL